MIWFIWGCCALFYAEPAPPPPFPPPPHLGHERFGWVCNPPPPNTCLPTAMVMVGRGLNYPTQEWFRDQLFRAMPPQADRQELPKRLEGVVGHRRSEWLYSAGLMAEGTDQGPSTPGMAPHPIRMGSLLETLPESSLPSPLQGEGSECL